MNISSSYLLNIRSVKKRVFNIRLLNVSKHLGAHGKLVKVQGALYLPSRVQYGSGGRDRSPSILLS